MLAGPGHLDSVRRSATDLLSDLHQSLPCSGPLFFPLLPLFYLAPFNCNLFWAGTLCAYKGPRTMCPRWYCTSPFSAATRSHYTGKKFLKIQLFSILYLQMWPGTSRALIFQSKSQVSETRASTRMAAFSSVFFKKNPKQQTIPHPQSLFLTLMTAGKSL